jgi:hypothetical protein
MLELISSAGRRAGYSTTFVVCLLGLLCATSCANPARIACQVTASPGAAALSSNIVIRTVQVSPRLPAYRFVLTPDPATDDPPPEPRHIGRIDIFKRNSKVVWQSIAVEGSHPDWLTKSFHPVDINFDGYLDFAVVYEIAGKWSSESYWLFDPGSGRFVTNALTAELRKLTHHTLTLDPRKKEIRISHFIGICLNSFENFRVENGQLVLMESEIHTPREPGRCLVEKRKRVNKDLTLIETQERMHEIPPSLLGPR